MSKQDTYDLISNNLGLNEFQENSEELLAAVTERVAWYLEHNVDLLMSYLYRLDVLEKDINQALSNQNPASPDLSIARLILDRQLQRVATKHRYKVDPIDGWEF